MLVRQVVFTAPGVAHLAQEDLREPRDDEVLVRNTVTLVSPGTERAFLLGLPNAAGSYPYHAGYSNVGVVEAVGKAVTGVRPGDRVVGGGRHAERCVLRGASVLPLPAGLAAQRAVFMQLGAIALQGVRKARIELGESVAVFGLGLIGLMAAQLATLCGGIPVVAVERDPFRLDVAEACGVADRVAAPGEGGAPAELLARSGGSGYDVVVEATGYPESIAQALHVAAPRGRVVLLGSTRGLSTVNFYEDVHRKGVQVIGAHNSVRPSSEDAPGYWSLRRDSACVLRLLAAERLHVDPCVTDRVGPEGAADLYARLGRWDPRLLAALIAWEAGG